MAFAFVEETITGWKTPRFAIRVAGVTHVECVVISQRNVIEVKIIFIGLGVIVAFVSCLMLFAFGLMMEMVLNTKNLPHPYLFEAAFLLLCVPAAGVALGWILERQRGKQLLAHYRNHGNNFIENKILGSWKIGGNFVTDLVIWCSLTMFLPGFVFKILIYLLGWNDGDLILGYLIIAIFSSVSFFYLERVLGKDSYSD